jgi:hypothetical protein
LSTIINVAELAMAFYACVSHAVYRGRKKEENLGMQLGAKACCGGPKTTSSNASGILKLRTWK